MQFKGRLGQIVTIESGEATVRCVQCGQIQRFPCSESAVIRWQHGDLIQEAMPSLTDAERELFLSGLCDPCFKALFAEEDDE